MIAMRQPFVFRLESVLRLRVRAEQKMCGPVAAAQARVRDCELRVKNIEQRIEAAGAQLERDLKRGLVDGARVSAHAAHVAALRAQANQAKRELGAANARLAVAQEALNKAMSQRKSLQKLRERHQDLWSQREQKEQSAVNDEVAARMFGWT